MSTLGPSESSGGKMWGRLLICRKMAGWQPAPRVAAVRRFFLRSARVLLLAYLFVLVIAMFLEDRLIYFPVCYPGGLWQPPGLAFEDAWFQAPEGPQIHGWYVPCKDARAVVLFCHGNGGNVTHRADALRRLRDLAHATVLIFDYRGYGRSEGSPSESGVLADARAARSWLAKRAAVDEDRIVLLGESLGGGVAVDLAAADGARGLVLESTFTSLPDIGAYHYPWLPVRWLARTRLDSLAKIGCYHGQLLISHGDADEIIPYQFGRRLFEAANEPKQFFTVRGGSHNQLRNMEYYEKLAEFFAKLP
jgi:uncharacterized protein